MNKNDDIAIQETKQLQQQTGKGIASVAEFVAELVEGIPYLYNGKKLNGFDCSGYVTHVFKHLFPEKGAKFETNVAGFITSDLFEDVVKPQVGDLIIFPKTEKYVNHMGIVESEHGWVGSQSSTGVAFVSFKNPFWSKRPHYFKRYKHSSPQAINAGKCGVKTICA